MTFASDQIEENLKNIDFTMPFLEPYLEQLRLLRFEMCEFPT